MQSIIIIILLLVIVYLVYKCVSKKETFIDVSKPARFSMNNVPAQYAFSDTIKSELDMDITNIPKQMIHQIQGEKLFPSNFYVKKDRYMAQDMRSGMLGSPFNDMEQSPWNVYYAPGTNGTVGDSVWSSESPKMVLQNNCIRCEEFAGNKIHNYPVGAQEKEEIDIPDKVKIDNQGILHSSAMLSDQVNCNEPSNLKYNASYRSGTGIVMPPKDCLSNKIHDGMIN